MEEDALVTSGVDTRAVATLPPVAVGEEECDAEEDGAADTSHDEAAAASATAATELPLADAAEGDAQDSVEPLQFSATVLAEPEAALPSPPWPAAPSPSGPPCGGGADNRGDGSLTAFLDTLELGPSVTFSSLSATAWAFENAAGPALKGGGVEAAEERGCASASPLRVDGKSSDAAGEEERSSFTHTEQEGMGQQVAPDVLPAVGQAGDQGLMVTPPVVTAALNDAALTVEAAVVTGSVEDDLLSPLSSEAAAAPAAATPGTPISAPTPASVPAQAAAADPAMPLSEEAAPAALGADSSVAATVPLVAAVDEEAACGPAEASPSDASATAATELPLADAAEGGDAQDSEAPLQPSPTVLAELEAAPPSPPWPAAPSPSGPSVAAGGSGSDGSSESELDVFLEALELGPSVADVSSSSSLSSATAWAFENAAGPALKGGGGGVKMLQEEAEEDEEAEEACAGPLLRDGSDDNDDDEDDSLSAGAPTEQQIIECLWEEISRRGDPVRLAGEAGSEAAAATAAALSGEAVQAPRLSLNEEDADADSDDNDPDCNDGGSSFSGAAAIAAVVDGVRGITLNNSLQRHADSWLTAPQAADLSPPLSPGLSASFAPAAGLDALALPAAPSAASASATSLDLSAVWHHAGMLLTPSGLDTVPLRAASSGGSGTHGASSGAKRAPPPAKTKTQLKKEKKELKRARKEKKAADKAAALVAAAKRARSGGAALPPPTFNPAPAPEAPAAVVTSPLLGDNALGVGRGSPPFDARFAPLLKLSVVPPFWRRLLGATAGLRPRGTPAAAASEPGLLSREAIVGILWPPSEAQLPPVEAAAEDLPPVSPTFFYDTPPQLRITLVLDRYTRLASLVVDPPVFVTESVDRVLATHTMTWDRAMSDPFTSAEVYSYLRVVSGTVPGGWFASSRLSQCTPTVTFVFKAAQLGEGGFPLRDTGRIMSAACIRGHVLSPHEAAAANADIAAYRRAVQLQRRGAKGARAVYGGSGGGGYGGPSGSSSGGGTGRSGGGGGVPIQDVVRYLAASKAQSSGGGRW